MLLSEHISQMRALAKQLLRYSFPLASPQDEEILSVLKQREIKVDGYDLIVYVNRCKYLDVELETIQVYGKYFTFLPFALVCKVAYEFLGNKELSLVEVMHHQSTMNEYSRKIYIWAVYYNIDGEIIPNPFVRDFTSCSFEGLNYNHINRNQITFF